MKNEIKIGFKHVTYFGNPIVDITNYFQGMSSYMLKEFNFVRSSNPDFVFSNRPLPKGPYIRIYRNPENKRPPVNQAEWLFGPDYADHVKHPSYTRQPNIVTLGIGKNLCAVKQNIVPEKILKSKVKFCAFVYAHNVPFRNKFFQLLNKYKRVDSPGLICNNMHAIGTHKSAHAARYSLTFGAEKINFLKPYKFVVAFENASYPGYISEKLTDPMLINSIPIYWGNPLIHRDFNPKSFIHPYGIGAHIKSEHQLSYLVEKVIELDRDDDKYLAYLRRPWYNDNKLPQFLDPKRIIKQYRKIFYGE